MDFKDKVFLVVGASSGMGRVFSSEIAKDGALLAVTARRAPLLQSLASEIHAAGGQCLALPADGLDEEAAQRVVDQTLAHYGRIDAVLLNAGGAPAIDMRLMNARDVKEFMRTNYDVLVNYLFPVLEIMKKQGSGVVAHTNSLAGFVPLPLQGPYCAAKAALRLLIDTCRMEFAGYGIKFFSNYPGFVDTEITRGDGVEMPQSITENEAVDHIIGALREEKEDNLFPPHGAKRIMELLAMPKEQANWTQMNEVPATPMPRVK